MRISQPGYLVALTALVVSSAQAQTGGTATHINPPGLAKPTGYTHVVVASDRRTVYIAGQVAYDSSGKMVGGEDFRAQAEQVFANLGRALKSVGGSFDDLVKTTTMITDRKNLPVLREVRNRYLDRERPPASTLIVAGLVRPELLLEIEAVAVLRTPFQPQSP
jgi:enamine deaminase RidA (YjgF/YER057c/UK114 family)